MSSEKRKILILVEGEKQDVNLMKHLLHIYRIDAKYEIVPYRTNIYTLFDEMFIDDDPEMIDLLQLLKSREKSEVKRLLFDEVYSDILLIFDLDPQAPEYHESKIKRMSEYFIESSDMGKLYINYPMVESFYHMKNIPDDDYLERFTTLSELKAGLYKLRVNNENRNRDYRKFAVNKSECNYVILRNLEKALLLVDQQGPLNEIPRQMDIFLAQSDLMHSEEKVLILSTCGFFFPEYNPKFLEV